MLDLICSVLDRLHNESTAVHVMHQSHVVAPRMTRSGLASNAKNGTLNISAIAGSSLGCIDGF